MGGLSAADKGALFEQLTKYYLLLNPIYRTELSDVWLLSEVPGIVRAELNLPDRDQGIDIIARTKTGKYWAVQCKYRTDQAHGLTWREISTFTGLAFEVCKNIEFGLIAYTGDRYTHVLKGASRINLLSSDVWNGLDAAFFDDLTHALKSKPVPLVARVPRPHQQRAIDKAVDYFSDRNRTRGKLIMPCGTGKSLTAFWIAEALKARTIVVAVPSLSLIQQTLPVWLREFAATGRDKGLRWLCVCSDQTVAHDPDGVVVHTQDLGFPRLTDADEISAWLRSTKSASTRVIFTTYQSGEALSTALRSENVVVDLGIMDEAHKTVGHKHKLFSHLLFDANASMTHRVFMTATERRFAGESDTILSMDDPSTYGETIELLSFKQALEAVPPILSDYKIITMVIAASDVAELVDNNRYLRTHELHGENEAQMVAAMIALRKAMRSHPIKHAVSFHSSIARATQFRDLNDRYSTITGEAVATYHVTGAMPATTRKRVIREFADSERSLITNARCLTEGVDVPGIDCVLFADPKQSTIDIVQAVGRALRPAPGKSCGYVIVPVITAGGDGTAFVESPAFKSVLTVLRALAGNDERIVEEFHTIASGRKPSGRIVEIEIDEKLPTTIDFNEFAASIEMRMWDRLSRLAWLSYDEAAAFVHGLGLKKQKEWRAYCRGERPELPPKPSDVPANPSAHFGHEFAAKGGFGAWLGTARRIGGWRPYHEARTFVHTLGLKSNSDWKRYYRGGFPDLPPKPADVPSTPNSVYGREFRANGGFGDWLGTGRIADQFKAWRPYQSAATFAQSLKLKNRTEWEAYCHGARPDLPPKPSDVPASPLQTYQHEFRSGGGWGGWLGTGNRKGGWQSYREAAEFVRRLGLRNGREWAAYCRGDRTDLPVKPLDIPNSPRDFYRDQFGGNGGWGGWLGTGNRRYRRQWQSYETATSFVRDLKLNNQSEWTSYCRGDRPDLPPKPVDVPNAPGAVYGDEFATNGGFSGWLGKEHIRGRSWRSLKSATKYVQTLKLKNLTEWRAYCRGERPDLPAKPADVPANPHREYGDLFIASGGTKAWLGTGK